MGTALGSFATRAEVEERLTAVLYDWIVMRHIEGVPKRIRVPIAVRMRLERMRDREKYLGR
jgi:hypothetical protein